MFSVRSDMNVWVIIFLIYYCYVFVKMCSVRRIGDVSFVA